MGKVKTDRIKLADFDISWDVHAGKGDAECIARIKKDGKLLGNVTTTVSKWRIDHLGYDRDLIIKAASRQLVAGLNAGRYKEITDAVEA